MGLELARLVRKDGGRLTIVARNEERLAAAATIIGGADTIAADLKDSAAVSESISSIGSLDHLVITAGTVVLGTLAQTEPAQWHV
jgi:NADP-dependent 3-hydroxy acid dehydrogenase YdfG